MSPADATPEDKVKTIQIGSRTLTGDTVYRALENYKKQEEKANSGIERTRKLSNASKTAEETIRSHLSGIDDGIVKMEEMIADFEVHQKILAIQGTLKDVIGDLSAFEVDALLNTDSILAEMQTESDKLEVLRNKMERERELIDLDRELSKIPLPNIDDDLP